MTRRQRQAKNAAEHRHMRDRIVRAYEGTSAALRTAGRLWYPTAEAVIAELSDRYGVSRGNTAAVVAALSPQTRWRSNIVAAEALLEGRRSIALAHAYPLNVAKADRVLSGDDADGVLGGPKVRAFWKNLAGNRNAVTVDVWAARAASGGQIDAPSPAQYLRIADAYAAAADMVGETNRETQAIVWLAVRPVSEHERDARAIQPLIESEVA